MTIKTTRWSPDTCSCVVEFTWDDSVAEDQRTDSLSQVIQKCPVHQAQSDPNVYSTLKDENPRKNIALGLSLDNGPSSLFDLNADGSRTLKGNISYNWSWSGTPPDRNLNISFTGINLTAQQKSAIQNFLNNRFGAGKVTLV